MESTEIIMVYRMTGNFRGVQIHNFEGNDLLSTKIKPISAPTGMHACSCATTIFIIEPYKVADSTCQQKLNPLKVFH